MMGSGEERAWHADRVAKLVTQMAAEGIASEHLDEAVHAAAAEIATAANNDGIAAQVSYLLYQPHWKSEDVLFKAREAKQED